MSNRDESVEPQSLGLLGFEAQPNIHLLEIIDGATFGCYLCPNSYYSKAFSNMLPLTLVK